MVLDAGPDIYNHNMETVERLTPVVRSRAKYRTSLQVLRRAKELSPESCDKERGHARPWRKGDRTFSDHGRFARGRLRSLDHGPISCARLRNICPLLNTSRPSNSITTATSRAEKVFSTSPPGRWFAALITRPIFIRLCADDSRNAGCEGWIGGDEDDRQRPSAIRSTADSFANRRGHSCVSG